MGAKRRKGFRPSVLAELRRMKSNLTVMVNTWSRVPSVVYYDAGDGKGFNWQPAETRRKRAEISASEYAENQPEQLRRLIDFMVVTRRDTDLLIEMARRRLAELEGR
jgi:hypothetical protein